MGIKTKKRDPGRVTDLCGECLLCCVHEAGSAFKEDQEGEGGVYCAISNICYLPK